MVTQDHQERVDKKVHNIIIVLAITKVYYYIAGIDTEENVKLTFCTRHNILFVLTPRVTHLLLNFLSKVAGHINRFTSYAELLSPSPTSGVIISN